MDFLEIFGIFKNRVFLQSHTDRGKPYICEYIGGQKKGHFRRFCEVLPIFFEKNSVGGDGDFDWMIIYKKIKKYLWSIASRASGPARPRWLMQRIE